MGFDPEDVRRKRPLWPRRLPSRTRTPAAPLSRSLGRVISGAPRHEASPLDPPRAVAEASRFDPVGATKDKTAPQSGATEMLWTAAGEALDHRALMRVQEGVPEVQRLRMVLDHHGAYDRGFPNKLRHARAHLLGRTLDELHRLRRKPDRGRDESHARHPIPVALGRQAVALIAQAVARRRRGGGVTQKSSGLPGSLGSLTPVATGPRITNTEES
jgi:hypothetical protein